LVVFSDVCRNAAALAGDRWYGLTRMASEREGGRTVDYDREAMEELTVATGIPQVASSSVDFDTVFVRR
jgi:hypothetical protein